MLQSRLYSSQAVGTQASDLASLPPAPCLQWQVRDDDMLLRIALAEMPNTVLHLVDPPW